MVVARHPGRRPGEEGAGVRSESAAESLLGDADFGDDAANSPAGAVLGDHLLDGARPCRGVEIAARAPLPDVVQHSKRSMEDERPFAVDSRFKVLDVEQWEGQVVIYMREVE